VKELPRTIYTKEVTFSHVTKGNRVGIGTDGEMGIGQTERRIAQPNDNGSGYSLIWGFVGCKY